MPAVQPASGRPQRRRGKPRTHGANRGATHHARLPRLVKSVFLAPAGQMTAGRTHFFTNRQAQAGRLARAAVLVWENVGGRHDGPPSCRVFFLSDRRSGRASCGEKTGYHGRWQVAPAATAGIAAGWMTGWHHWTPGLMSIEARPRRPGWGSRTWSLAAFHSLCARLSLRR